MDINTVTEQLKPSLTQLVTCIVLDAIIVATVYWTTLLKYFTNTASSSQSGVDATLQVQLSSLHHNHIFIWIARLMMLLAAAIICLLLYRLLVLASRDVLKEVIAAEEAYTPEAKRAFHGKLILQSFLAVGLFLFLFISIKLFMPIWLALFGVLLLQSLSLLTIACIAVALVGSTLNIYLAWCLARLVLAVV